MRKTAKKKNSMLRLVAVNIILVAVVAVSFLYYNNAYKEELNAENLSNIANINSSASNIALARLKFKTEKLEDVHRYCEQHALTAEELLDYIYQSTAPDRAKQYQLIGSDYRGWAAYTDNNGDYAKVDYSELSYADIHDVIDDMTEGRGTTEIQYTPEFTNGDNGVRSFAYYMSLFLLSDSNALTPYTLMLVTESEELLEAINTVLGYDGIASVLMSGDGTYIVSSNSFKDVNLFDYFYTYNSLVLDERNAVLQEVTSKSSGEIYFSDYRKQPCVFRYSVLKDTSWYCVTVVPLDSFRENDMEIGFTVTVALLLIFLAVTDVLWFLRLNRKLAGTMLKERVANNAKTDFLSRMSHDIRTPLNGIIGNTYLALKEDNPPATQEYLRVIDISGKFLLGLVNDVLDMSKVESGKMELHLEPYSYSELCDYIKSVIKPLCDEKKLDLIISGADNTQIMTDSLRLNQIFFNLLSNSVKFTPEGGIVELTLESRKLENGRLLMHFTVRDTGIGMSKDFQKHMFEAFSQEESMSKSSSSGTGLGLAIVWNLVTLIGGKISVESSPGEGTVFELEFEADICDESYRKEEKHEVDTSRLDGAHVLLCEDNYINTMLAKKLLEAKGVQVDCADNGQQGVEIFISSQPGYYDAVLMDIMMPVLDGLSAAREIRESAHPDAKRVPIIAMTANAYADDIENCINAGMNDHVSKPVNPSELYKKLSANIGG